MPLFRQTKSLRWEETTGSRGVVVSDNILVLSCLARSCLDLSRCVCDECLEVVMPSTVDLSHGLAVGRSGGENCSKAVAIARQAQGFVCASCYLLPLLSADDGYNRSCCCCC